MYSPYQQFQASPETLKIIQEATQGKIDALWEAEEQIVQAILADTTIPYMAKANEINRCMHRFLTTANSYGLSGVMYPGAYQPIAPMQAPMPMSGYNYGMGDPSMHNMPSTNLGPIAMASETVLTSNYTVESGEEYHVNTKRIGGKINGIDLSSSGGTTLTARVIGVLNNYEDRDAIAIGVIGVKDTFVNPEVMDIVFRHVAETLGMDKEGHLYSYTVRKGEGDASVLYIDMVDGCDSLDIEAYSDLIRGNILTYSIYDDLFPEAADPSINTTENAPTGPGNSVE